MSTEEARNIIAKDSLISNGNLLALVNGGETALHSHADGGGGSGDTYYDRGDPTSYDYAGDASISTDGSWHTMDLSGIVTAGAKQIWLRGFIQDGTVGAYLQFRENGNSNTYNSPSIFVTTANSVEQFTFPVTCDANRVIEYRASNLTFTNLGILVMGWVI